MILLYQVPKEHFFIFKGAFQEYHLGKNVKVYVQ